jgi:hypothetical protein
MRDVLVEKKIVAILNGQCSADPDEIKLLDECSAEWAEAWKAAAEKSFSKYSPIRRRQS